VVKKSIVFILLFSMALHCTCRLGILEQVYRKRHHIAYSLGLISQIPITLCSHDFHFGNRLTIKVEKEDAKSLPNFFKVSEINLFFYTEKIDFENNSSENEITNWGYIPSPKYNSPIFSIYHPPSIS